MFFFFKQKTAYELRISDWSSDVCSSDLTVNVSANHYRSDSRNAYVSFAETGHSNLYNPVRVARPQTPKYVGGDMHSPLLTERIQTTSVAVADTMSFLRSEEHTSELQSLMRISYAVFCLKNKKTKV